MLYDIDKIKEEATPIAMIKYLSKPCKKSGGSLFIECPVHMKKLGKKDRHINNCVLNAGFEKAFYCFGCNSSGSVFDMVAGYLDLDEKKDFPKILKIIAEACGNEEYFMADPQERFRNRANNELEAFRLSSDELTELGLITSVFSTRYIASYDESLLEDHYQLTKEINMDILNKNKLQKISYLESENKQHLFNTLEKELYISLVKQKAVEKMALYKQLSTDESLHENTLLSSLPMSQRQSLSDGLKNIFRKKYIKIKNIYLKIASTEEIKNIDDSWLFDFNIYGQELKPGSLF